MSLNTSNFRVHFFFPVFLGLFSEEKCILSSVNVCIILLIHNLINLCHIPMRWRTDIIPVFTDMKLKYRYSSAISTSLVSSMPDTLHATVAWCCTAQHPLASVVDAEPQNRVLDIGKCTFKKCVSLLEALHKGRRSGLCSLKKTPSAFWRGFRSEKQ